MKKTLLILMMFFMVTGVVYAKEFEVKKSVDGYDVVVRIDKNPPATGNNNIAITITEAGKPVTDAKVTVNYTMPAMPGMPPMDYKAETTLKGKEYVAIMDFSMSGAWNIAIKIKKGDKTSTVKFNLDVR